MRSTTNVFSGGVELKINTNSKKEISGRRAKEVMRGNINVTRATFSHTPLFKIFINASLPDSSVTHKARALFDSASTHDFISEELVKLLDVHTSALSNTMLHVTLPDNSVMKCPMRTADVQVEVNNYSEVRTFVVLALKTYDIVFGRPWLRDLNPHLNWQNNQVQFRHKGKRVDLNASEDFDSQDWLKAIPGSICAVEARRICKEESGEIFTITVKLPTHETETTGVRFGANEPLLLDVFKEYEDIFPPELPDGLPPHRGRFDHSIKLINESLRSAGYTIRLSTLEIELLQTTIADLIKKGFISPSNSPFGAPCFFVKKPHSPDLRLVIDWRALNDNTVKDKTPLPHISDLLARLHSARFFSVLDAHSGFHQVLVKEADREKTAFRTPFGLYEWNVMGFGLTNAPATFQSLMNDVFKNHLRKFIAVYMDDVLIYSDNLKDHVRHLRIALQLLRDRKVYCKPKKCILGASEVLYLGHVIGGGGIKVDPEKIKTINNLARPTSKSEISTFLGMCSYLCEHIQHYAEVALPLTNATHDDVGFDWTDECEESFNLLKNMITTAPVLLIPDPNKPFIIASDASDHSGGAVLIQLDVNGTRRPVAYWSRKWTSSELKWPTRDKECKAMLDSIENFSTWVKGRYFTVESDHHSLQHLRTQKKLLPRQERLLDILADYDFNIVYVPGKDNQGADGLSRLPSTVSASTERTNTQYLRSELHATQNQEKTSSTNRISAEFLTECRRSYDSSPFFKRLLARLSLQPKDQRGSHIWKLVEGLLFYYDVDGSLPRLGIPTYELQLKLLKEAHDAQTSNHQGVAKTAELLRKNFFWPHMLRSVDKFVKECELCQRAKDDAPLTPGFLLPLEIPTGRWTEISMDFVNKLVKTPRGFTSIFTVVDRFTKRVRFIPTTDEATAEDVAKLFYTNIVCQFGVPNNIVSDRDGRFTSESWTAFVQLLGTTLSMSTVDHPQSDGQSERMHKTLNARLRTLVNHAQDNWDLFLPSIEFSINSAVNESTGYAPFMLDIGRIPRTPLNSIVNDLMVPAPASLANFIKGLRYSYQEARDNILTAQEHQRNTADDQRRQQTYEVGDQVLVRSEMLRSSSTQASRPKSKLDLKFDGPYSITKVVNSNSYEVSIPPGVHNVMNITKLKPYIPQSFANRYPAPPAPDESRITGPELVVQKIVARKRIRGRNPTGVHKDDPSRFAYLTHWAGERQDMSSWEPYTSFVTGDETSQALLDFLSTIHEEKPTTSYAKKKITKPPQIPAPKKPTMQWAPDPVHYKTTSASRKKKEESVTDAKN